MALRDSIQRAEDDPAEATPLDAEGWSHVARRLMGNEEPLPLRGRVDVVERARAFAESGSGVLLIIGEAGIGKSRLVVETARFAASAGARLLLGVGYDFDGIAPYTPFVDAWSDHLRRNGLSQGSNPFVSFAPTPGASAQEDRLRLFQLMQI